MVTNTCGVFCGGKIAGLSAKVHPLAIGCYFPLKHLSLGRLLLEVGTVYNGELTLKGEPVEELFMSPQATACFSLFFFF